VARIDVVRRRTREATVGRVDDGFAVGGASPGMRRHLASLRSPIESCCGNIFLVVDDGGHDPVGDVLRRSSSGQVR
jgi:hypothetical protein